MLARAIPLPYCSEFADTMKPSYLYFQNVILTALKTQFHHRNIKRGFTDTETNMLQITERFI